VATWALTRVIGLALALAWMTLAAPAAQSTNGSTNGSADRSGGQEDSVRLITNIDHRETVSLNGGWRVIVDPYEVGCYDYRCKPSHTGFFLDEQAEDPSRLIEYNFDTPPADRHLPRARPDPSRHHGFLRRRTPMRARS